MPAQLKMINGRRRGNGWRPHAATPVFTRSGSRFYVGKGQTAVAHRGGVFLVTNGRSAVSLIAADGEPVSRTAVDTMPHGTPQSERAA